MELKLCGLSGVRPLLLLPFSLSGDTIDQCWCGPRNIYIEMTQILVYTDNLISIGSSTVSIIQEFRSCGPRHLWNGHQVKYENMAKILLFKRISPISLSLGLQWQGRETEYPLSFLILSFRRCPVSK